MTTALSTVMIEPNRIPVLRPQLPPAEQLLPVLKRIDEARIYTNWGPLSSELEGRLARTLRLPAGGVVSASSGTAALVGAILPLPVAPVEGPWRSSRPSRLSRRQRPRSNAAISRISRTSIPRAGHYNRTMRSAAQRSIRSAWSFLSRPLDVRCSRLRGMTFRLVPGSPL